MRSHIPYKLTSAQQKAIREECDRQAAEFERENGERIYAVMLWSLHVHTGWGKKRLKSFWHTLCEEHKRLVKCYEMPNEWPFLCSSQLKKIGIDVNELRKELDE